MRLRCSRELIEDNHIMVKSIDTGATTVEVVHFSWYLNVHLPC